MLPFPLQNPYTKIAGLWDIHHPFHIDLNPTLNCLHDFKPDILILGGDCVDLAYMSHWNELSPRTWENKRLKKDYEEFGALLDAIRTKIAPKKIYYLLGNHEDWVEQFVNRFPTIEGLLDIETGLHLKERQVEVIEQNKPLHIGKLYFIHGMYIQECHARKTVAAYQRNVRYGHTHDYQTFSFISPVDIRDTKTAMSCGCLCNRNPDYAKHQPNRWIHGWYAAYMYPDGSFTDFFVPIFKGRFTFNNKLYE